jgi:hypothetical protein
LTQKLSVLSILITINNPSIIIAVTVLYTTEMFTDFVSCSSFHIIVDGLRRRTLTPFKSRCHEICQQFGCMFTDILFSLSKQVTHVHVHVHFNKKQSTKPYRVCLTNQKKLIKHNHTKPNQTKPNQEKLIRKQL